jgi:hypothetical protein
MILILLNSQFGTSPILERHSKGDEPVLSDLKKAGVYLYPFSNCPVKWKTPTDVETPPERIHVTYCDHIENTEETSESDEGSEN